MSIKHDANYALFLLIMEEIDDSFKNELNLNELDDDNYELIKIVLLALSSNRYLVSQKHNIVKSKHWWYEILPLYDDIQYKKVLRMEKQQFNRLVQILQHDIVFQDKGNKPQASVDFQLAIFL